MFFSTSLFSRLRFPLSLFLLSLLLFLPVVSYSLISISPCLSPLIPLSLCVSSKLSSPFLILLLLYQSSRAVSFISTFLPLSNPPRSHSSHYSLFTFTIFFPPLFFFFSTPLSVVLIYFSIHLSLQHARTDIYLKLNKTLVQFDIRTAIHTKLCMYIYSSFFFLHLLPFPFIISSLLYYFLPPLHLVSSLPSYFITSFPPSIPRDLSLPYNLLPPSLP